MSQRRSIEIVGSLFDDKWTGINRRTECNRKEMVESEWENAIAVFVLSFSVDMNE